MLESAPVKRQLLRLADDGAAPGPWLDGGAPPDAFALSASASTSASATASMPLPEAAAAPPSTLESLVGRSPSALQVWPIRRNCAVSQ